MKYIMKDPDNGWLLLNGLNPLPLYVSEPEDASVFNDELSLSEARGENDWEVYSITYSTELVPVMKKSERIIQTLVDNGILNDDNVVIDPLALSSLITNV